MQLISRANAQEASRLTNLAYYDVVDSLPEQAYDDITLLAAHICQVPIALISFIDGERQWPKSHFGSTLTPVDRESSLCARAILQPHQPMIIPDAAQDERFANNPLVGGRAGVRFYAGVPLVSPQGYALGTLCVIDTKPNTLSVSQTQALSALARQVMILLELRVKGRALQQALAKEWQEQQTKAKFVGLVAHEFRTPLTTIAISTDLLGRYAGQLKAQTELPLERPIERIRIEIKNFTTLLDRILTCSQLNAGKVALRPRPVNLIALSRELISTSFGDWPDGRAAQLEIQGTPALVRVDPRLIGYVLTNLLTNAFKFSGQNPVLRLRFAPRRLLMQIIDKGIGIPASELPHLFEPFYRASNAGPAPGTGLGLSIARQLTELQGISLEVSSQLGQGSTFTVGLNTDSPASRGSEPPPDEYPG